MSVDEIRATDTERTEYRNQFGIELDRHGTRYRTDFAQLSDQFHAERPAALDEVIESGRIDFVDDLANVVPAVLTMAMLGFPMADWITYCEPIHAQVYTKPGTPEADRVQEQMQVMAGHTLKYIADIRANPRPGLINALINADIGGRQAD